jgi:hypothetical protein
VNFNAPVDPHPLTWAQKKPVAETGLQDETINNG